MSSLSSADAPWSGRNTHSERALRADANSLRLARLAPHSIKNNRVTEKCPTLLPRFFPHTAEQLQPHNFCVGVCIGLAAAAPWCWTKMPWACTSRGLAASRFVVAMAAVVLGMCSTLVIPTHKRPEPVQRVQLPGSNVTLFILDPAFNNGPCIADAHASCPSALLSALIVAGLLFTILANCDSLLHALDAAKVYLFALALTSLLTVWFKNYCGFFRPNYFPCCGWDDVTHGCSRDWLEGRHSFPSGHSSSSMSGATVLTLYLLRKLEGWRKASSAKSPWMPQALQCATVIPGVVASWVAASRVHDNWHHPADIITGATLGAAIAALIFRLLANEAVLPQPATSSGSATAFLSAMSEARQ